MSEQRKSISRSDHKSLSLAHGGGLLRRSDGDTRVRLVVLLEHGLVLLDGSEPLGLDAAHALQAHGQTAVERAQPHGIDVRHLGEDGVEVVDALQRLDLDDDGGLVVGVLVHRHGLVDGLVHEAGEEPEGRRASTAVVLCAVLGRGHDVLCLLDRVDLRDDDAGAGIEGEADGGVIVTGNAVYG